MSRRWFVGQAAYGQEDVRAWSPLVGARDGLRSGDTYKRKDSDVGISRNAGLWLEEPD